MKALGRILMAIIGVELLTAAVLFGLRLNSTRVSPPLVEPSHDAITGRELLALSDRFLFDSAAKWRTLGEAYLVKGHFAKAEACLRRAHEADPQSADVAYPLGLCLERLGRMDEAVAVFHQAAGHARRDLAPVCWHHVGLNHLRMENADEAASAFESAGDAYLPSVYERVKLLVRSGRAADAAPLLDKLAEAHPDDLHVLFYRARAAAQLGREDEAFRLYDAYDRGLLAMKRDDTEEYHRRLREGIGMAREIARAISLQQAGASAESADLLTRLAAEDSRWENSYLFLLVDAANAHVDAKRFSAARPLVERQLRDQQFPTATVWELLGDVENAAGKSAEAREAWTRAARMHSHPRLQIKLASVARQRGDEKLSQHHQALAVVQAGIGQFRANRFKEARTTLLQATSLDATNPDVWFYLGECERLLDRPAEAAAAYRRCLKLKPHHGRALGRLARAEAAPAE